MDLNANWGKKYLSLEIETAQTRKDSVNNDGVILLSWYLFAMRMLLVVAMSLMIVLCMLLRRTMVMAAAIIATFL
jgi:hypothetical protein